MTTKRCAASSTVFLPTLASNKTSLWAHSLRAGTTLQCTKYHLVRCLRLFVVHASYSTVTGHRDVAVVFPIAESPDPAWLEDVMLFLQLPPTPATSITNLAGVLDEDRRGPQADTLYAVADAARHRLNTDLTGIQFTPRAFLISALAPYSPLSSTRPAPTGFSPTDVAVTPDAALPSSPAIIPSLISSSPPADSAALACPVCDWVQTNRLPSDLSCYALACPRGCGQNVRRSDGLQPTDILPPSLPADSAALACPVCDWVQTNHRPSDLARHALTHKAPQLVCTRGCGQKFRRSDGLKRHLDNPKTKCARNAGCVKATRGTFIRT
ncbi:hypothetical protein FA95DRAFT_652772 [Auriscalpium vulgare]|uniref:Uncharacterized protein n=1 Tax=Auriscalpium vulgare TaxID=40419 RepID=A0ACB8RCE1_9AGAM|nr:hypothetical protein FA95DRAFT_652772 [Auriscalpium vulgare]